MTKQNPSTKVIHDFEDGVDAIEFMIEGFGFEDAASLRDDDPPPPPERGELRLVHADPQAPETLDFVFPEPE